jgi:hypothetical protein
MRQAPNIGERVVVHGVPQKATVESVTWDAEANSWRVNLDWGGFGKSRVWLHDENKVWYRLSAVN